MLPHNNETMGQYSSHECPSIRVQAVLFNTTKDSLNKSLSTINNAASKYNGTVSIAYGDASEEPSLPEDELDRITELYPNITTEYTFFNENTGFGKGHNILASTCTSSYIFIINPDILIPPQFFKTIINPFSDPTVGIVEARQSPIEHPKAFDRETGETSWASGACTMIPTSLFKEVGGYDSNTFWMYCEDVDLSWRIRLLGKKIIYCPAAYIIHPKSLSSSARYIPTETEIYHSALSALFMAYKWSNVERLNQLLSQFANSTDEPQQFALSEFKRRAEAHNLPNQIQAPKNIAAFYPDGNYAEHRYPL